MFFEDFVVKACDIVESGSLYNLSEWTKNFILNIGNKIKINDKTQLSTNQAAALQKVLPNFIKYLVKEGFDKSYLEQLIKNPVYKNELYISSAVKREVRHLGADYLGFRFKFNPLIVQSLKKNSNCEFNRENNLWIIKIIAYNFENVMECIHENKFEIDSNTHNYLTECKKIYNTKPYSIGSYDNKSDCIIVNVKENETLSIFVKEFLEGSYI